MGLEKSQGLILDTAGNPINVPTIQLTGEEARLLRLYKKFLDKNGLKEALYCDSCWEQNLSHGCEAYVTAQQIIIKCRCKIRHFTGPTY